MVDASQNILVREHDCGTLHFDTYSKHDKKTLFGDTFENKLFGKYTAQPVQDADKKELYPAGTLITKDVLETIVESSVEEVAVRSVLTCESEE